MSTKAEPLPEFWLRCRKWGETGPYTKDEARSIVARHPWMNFYARRAGEMNWMRARRRLAKHGHDFTLVFLFGMLFAVITSWAMGTLLGPWFAAGGFLIVAIGSIIIATLKQSFEDIDAAHHADRLTAMRGRRASELRCMSHPISGLRIIGTLVLLIGLFVAGYDLFLSAHGVDFVTALGPGASDEARAHGHERMLRLVGGLGIALCGAVLLGFSGLQRVEQK